ncbi:MAG: hypothetical protein Fur0010_05640 [Bdellovibrio sp.]
MQHLSLSRTQLSSIYAGATLLGSFNLTILGNLVDRWSARTYLTVLTVAVSGGLIFLSEAKGMISLFLAYFILRAYGQMGFGLFATTYVSRLFHQSRGKAISVLGIGRSSAEGILPNLGAILAASFGAMVSMKIVAMTVVAYLVPFIFFILPRLPKKIEDAPENSHNKNHHLNWSWKNTVLNNKRSFLLMITLAFIPFSVTALFFQQSTLANERAWDVLDIAKGFWFYSACLIVGNFTWGPLVDRFRAINLLPFVMIPLGLGLCSLIFIKSLYGYFLYMMCLGLSVSLSGMLRHTLYAELFGVMNLGRIKGMDGNILIIGTSLGPLLSGLFLDSGLSMILFLQFLLGLTLINAILLKFLHYKFK